MTSIPFLEDVELELVVSGIGTSYETTTKLGYSSVTVTWM